MIAPTPQGLSQLLTELLSRGVEVTATPLSGIKAGEFTIAAAYRADDQRLASVGVCDLGSVIYAGAALGLHPAQAAKEDFGVRRLNASVVENFNEVLNICATWVSLVVRKHVKLGAVYYEEAKQPADVRAMCRARAQALHLNLNIAGYGAGRITLLR